MTTIVKSLYLRAEEYGADKGKLSGTIEFVGQYGEVKVRVNNDQGARILAIVAEEVVAAAKQTAAMLTSEVIAQADGRLLIEG